MTGGERCADCRIFYYKIGGKSMTNSQLRLGPHVPRGVQPSAVGHLAPMSRASSHRIGATLASQAFDGAAVADRRLALVDRRLLMIDP